MLPYTDPKSADLMFTHHSLTHSLARSQRDIPLKPNKRVRGHTNNNPSSTRLAVMNFHPFDPYMSISDILMNRKTAPRCSAHTHTFALASSKTQQKKKYHHNFKRDKTQKSKNRIDCHFGIFYAFNYVKKISCALFYLLRNRKFFSCWFCLALLCAF